MLSTPRRMRSYLRSDSAAGAVALCLLLSMACAQGAEDGLARARDLQAEGKVEEALVELRALIEEHPDHPEANYQLGLALLATGARGGALVALHKAAASEEFAVEAGIAEASLMLQTNNGDEALRSAEHVLAIEPENETALLLFAEAALAVHDGTKALEAGDRLVALNPAPKGWQLLRAKAFAELSRWSEAEAIFGSLWAEPWEDDAPGANRTCVAYAKYFGLTRKDKEQAKRVIEDCVKARPDDGQLALDTARVYLDLDDSESSVNLLRAASERLPEEPVLKQALSEALLQADRFAEAETLVAAQAAQSDDADSWRNVSIVRRRAGDVEGALEAAEKALAHPPGGSGEEPLFLKADLLVEQGRLDEAEAAATGFTTPLYKNVIAARLAQERGDPKRALELFGSAIVDWPGNYGLRVLAARAALDLGDVERALSELLEASRQAPRETDAALWLSRLHFSRGNYDLAYEFAVRHMRTRGTTGPAGHFAATKVLIARGKLKEAMSVLDDLSKKHDGKFMPLAFAEAARLTSVYSSPEAGLKVLNRVVEKHKIDLGKPESEPLMRQLGEIYVALGRSAEAERRIAALRDANPKRVSLQVMHGRLSLAMGKFEDAGADFDRALELEPNLAEALAGRAMVLESRGDLKGALAAATRAQEQRDHPDHAYAVARLQAALGDPAKARVSLEAILRRDPDHGPSANDLAYMLAESGESLERAHELSQMAMRLTPSPDTFDTAGYVLLKQGKHEPAVELFERALEKRPSYATARFHLALALIETGKRDAAKTALRSALEANSFPEREQAQSALARLDSNEIAQ